jgi:hypothetical protein
MDLFGEMIAVVGAIVGGIIVLTLFFKLIGWIERRGAKPVSIRGVLDNKARCTVYTGGKTIENVLISFVDEAPAKGIPYQLRGWVVLEHADGRRTMLQAKTIRMIEVEAQSAS